MVSPPKPWERNGPAATTSPSTATSTTLASSPAPSTTTTTAGPSSQPPAVPDRPPTIASSSMTSPYSTYGTSPYSRLGSYGYGGLGSYGSMYGGYGGMGMGSYGGVGTYGMGSYGGMGYGGYGGMGMGMGGLLGPNGMPMDPNNPSLTQTLEATTQNTFALLHSIVQTFTGLAQMLESTFMATHSSFFAMVGVADQLGQLRNALGSVLGLFGLLRWLRELITGRSSAGGLNHEFREFINGKPVQGPMTPPPPKTSKKPIIIFLLAIFGVPYAMSKLIRLLNERAQAQAAAAGHLVPGPNGQLPPLDPSQLTFARALYPFAPTNSNELALKENEIVAIMAKVDPRTGMEVDPRTEVESDWWKGRTRDGREGWFPKKWVEVLQRRRPDEAKKVD